MSATKVIGVVAVCDRIGCVRRRNFLARTLREAVTRAGGSGWRFGAAVRGTESRESTCPECTALGGGKPPRPGFSTWETGRPWFDSIPAPDKEGSE